jgi:diguanylate cyclase (GGDEF)-like protein
MADEKVTLLFRNTADSSLLRMLALSASPTLACQTVEAAAALSPQDPPDVLIIESSLADYALLRPHLNTRTAALVTSRDERAAPDRLAGWPMEFYADFAPFPTDRRTREGFLRALSRALEVARLKAQVETLAAQKASQNRVREVFSEIREIKSFINDNVVRELEKRVALQVRYLWFQRRKQKIEDILRKIYIADDVSSLLDTVYDIKALVQASGITFYILDENETLGQYLKPLVWDDAFLSHHEFSRYIALLDSPDFAAQAVRHREDINLSSFSLDKRLAKRYVEHLKHPLRSLLCVPIMHEKEVIGVLEVYNKLADGEVSRQGFSREDQQVLRGLSEHISLAMTKLNLIQYDALTGLLRPDPFFEKVIQKINQRSKRRQEVASYAMVMGDVDWFKLYNDRNGHEAGNRLLRQLSAVLKSSIREEDLICRYGGEEFLFFLTGVNSLEEACVLTERIRKSVEAQYFEKEEFQPRSNLTMSFGVTLLPRREEFFASINRYELRKIASEADMALAEAKGKRFYGQKAPGEPEADASKNKVCAYQREAFDRDRGGGVAPFRQEFFEEKRRHERHYISTLLLYQENGHFKVTKTINMSLGGLRIFSDSKLPLAKALDLFLILESRATAFKGEVVYSQKTADEPAEYQTGIKFREMAAAEKQVLEDFLAAVSKREAAG